MLVKYRDKLILTSRKHGEIPLDVIQLSDAENTHIISASGPFGLIKFQVLENEEYHLWQSNYELRQDLLLSTVVDEPYLGFHFILKNDFNYTLKGLPSMVLLEHQYNLAYVPHFECEHDFRAANYTAFGIRISPRYLERWAESFTSVSTFLEEVAKKKPVQISKIPMAVNPEITAIILNLLHCTYTGALKKMYMDIKIPELVFLALQRNGSSFPKIRLREDDRKKIQEAREYIIANMNNPGTISDLAHEVGINDFKLKSGFKELYGTTIYGFLLEERMEQAWVKIIESDMSIKKIAETTGYSNLSGFSAAFKKRFGYPPSALRKRPIQGSHLD